MDITWLGHAATRVRTRNAAIVMDPTDRDGGDMGRPDAHIVTVSHAHPQHSHVEGVKNWNRGEVMVLDGPGEYEILGVQVEAVDARVAAAADSNGATLAAAARVFAFAAEEMTFAHLGGLSAAPTGELAELLAGRDIVIVPIECEEGLTPAGAASIVRGLEAKVVIPVGYKPTKSGTPAALKTFIDELGVTSEAPVSRATIQRRNLGDTMHVVLLESRG